MAGKRVLGAHMLKFAIVGVLTTILNLVLFAALAHVMSNQAANITSLVICTILNTAANRRFTFAVKDRQSGARVPLQALLLLAITWAMTAGALAILESAHPHPSKLLATGTVAAGNVVATVIRFVLLRRWFAPGDPEMLVAESAPTAL